ARLHPRYRIPHVALLVSTGLSTVMAMLFVDNLDTLTSMVNIGALSAFFSVHLSVLVLLHGRRRSGRWLAHGVVPLAGMAIIVTLISQMSLLAIGTAAAWFAVGLVRVLLLKPAAVEAVMEV
ncbi:MAG TPA: hypothetical protein VKS60_24680, partial [Stellaceae bacterium]|nr:hypothetical protein [Stellaceae bacterium]